MSQPELVVLPAPYKGCSICKESKPLSEFYQREDTGKLRNQCRACVCKKVEDWYDNNRDKAKNTILKRVYGIDFERYQELLATQKGRCAICERPPKKRQLSVDHCHKTKKIRGLLCSDCNITLGNMRDNPKLLRAAAQYLENLNG